ncbi:T9SS type B sorting domain-containing protein [Flavobacterium eburneipallidum]|uniref:T9SS type B sorting domain-containing protein n=1 Tax=Flavobacterium eburneipallidum TaxID=3003263 RepID=UPI0024824975|nr:T9SS type B sorting domain-containing protein [Flavobacterium eburneipallidum]
MKKIFIICLVFASMSCLAQFSKTHYIPPVIAQDGLAEDHYLYISTPSITPINFKIIEIGGATISATVSNTTPYVHYIGTGNNTRLITPKFSTGITQDKGFIIEAEALVYVSMRVNSARTNNGGYNHAGGLVSKGNSALGTTFRLGAMLNPNVDFSLLNFASILSTENNTTVTISNIPIGTVFANGTVYNGPITVTLKKNESYTMALENFTGSGFPSNSSKIIGALVESNKDVVVNSGSFGGSNSTSTNGRDLGFDQIVSLEKIGKEYIFVKGIGNDDLERVLLIAHTPNIDVFLNGSTTPYTTIANAGDYVVIDGSQFSNGNLYVTTSDNVFAYQSIGGSASPANQNMFFVPPLNCSTPNSVDNIPVIGSIGNNPFPEAGLNIVTEKGAIVNVYENGNSVAIGSATAITGNPGFERYSIARLTGNISVKSTKQVYVSYYGTNNAATYGGYYSGFDIKPEIISEIKVGANSNCIPNIELKISTLSSYDIFQWFKNDVEILGETSNSYNPTASGYYQVRGTTLACGIPIFSDKIPVSECPTDIDSDKVNDNIDIDNDNDGITNCTESYGNQNIDLTNIAAGTVAVGTYSNSFTGQTISSGGTITGISDGSFITTVPAGVDKKVTYKMTFTNPISLGMEYVTTANTTDLLNADAEYIINSDVNKTITVLNPDNQLLIDTNYDGIYESGITEYSSFEIRFRLNSTVPLVAGTGNFKFLTYLSNSISFTHKNLSDTNPNQVSLKFFASCVPKDSDLDGNPDQLDIDSDNDGIPDVIEAQVNNMITLSNADTNKNGLDNAFEPGFTPFDNDNDGIPDYLDLDSDNDGILDSVEIGIDTDADGIRNYRDSDSDNDLCNDVIEAGFLDGDVDGKFGNSPITVDSNGKVIGAPYTAPHPNYTTAAPIVITTQPIVAPTCELQNASISLVDNGGNSYQWQLSTDGINWNNLSNSATYPNVNANPLIISTITNAMNGYKYRVVLNKTGNSCGLTSAETTLTIYPLPIVNDVTIVQCDDDLDARSAFNLTVKNNEISSNAANETFTYYSTLAGANTANAAQLITTPLAFTNTTPSTMDVWTRVTNTNGCFRVAKITLKVSATQIPSTFNRPFVECDDLLDTNGLNNANNDKRDGIATFNFSSVTNDIKALLPAGNYSIKYYKNQADALAELNAITDISNYRNIGYPNTQNIWVRVDSDVDNACYGLGPFVTLTVEKLPFANPVSIPRQCDDNHDGIFPFDTSSLETTLLGTNQSFPVTVTYFDANNNPLKDANGVLITSPFPATFNSTSQTIRVVVTNNTTEKCSDETTIQFIVDDLPQAFAVPANLTTSCDDEADPLTQDGKIAFDTTTFEATILGGQTGMMVQYLDGSGNLLSSPLPNPFVTGTQNVTATVINPVNNTCTASVILPFIVNPLPKINLNLDGSDDVLICNQPIFNIQLQAGIEDGSPASDYAYIWSKDGSVLPTEIAPTLNVTTEGVYTVEVINTTGCSRIRIIKVTSSAIAEIQTVAVTDMADTNTVTITVTGTGDYQYSLDEPTGFFQDSNTFVNIPSGIHELYIKDKNGCDTVSRTIAVVGVPKFFTPNNDGYNDYWNVKGINTTENANSIIYIYDRYGKLLKKLSASDIGWDGNFNGNPLPSDDYWYTLQLGDGREAKGHFSLKR